MEKENYDYDESLEVRYKIQEILEEIEGEKVETNEEGQPTFQRVNHKERVGKFGVLSDGETSKFLNIALEYFNHRCALSGEGFVYRDTEEIDRKITSNLSAEHVVALCSGGHDIVPNLVPSVLQYNISKNGYYLLDWWKHQTDTEGKAIYSPYRLLKLTNFMIKSLQAREYSRGKKTTKKVEKYKEIILTDNEIDKFLKEIELQDEIENLEKDNRERKIYSSVITATTLDKDNKKILTELPQTEANMPSRARQIRNKQQVKEEVMIDIFLMDAIRELKRQIPHEKITTKDGEEIRFDIEQLEQLANEVMGIIPIEVEIRNIILEEIKELGITDNVYSVANDFLKNSGILESIIKENVSFEEIREEIRENIRKELTKQFARVEEIVGKEKLCEVIATTPEVLYIDENIEMYVKIILPKYEQELVKLKVEGIDEIDERNINTAMKIIESYDFEKILGRQLQEEERKILIEKLLGKSVLKKEGDSYISTLYTKLIKVGLEEKEAYGAILNYAMGNGNYSNALYGKTKYTSQTIKDIKIHITEEEFCNGIRKIIPRYEEQITKLKIERLEEIDERNINTAMKIMENYDFEKTLERQLEDDERKLLIEKLLGNSGLKKGIGCSYISTLYTKLIKVGLEEKEAYGAILNYAIGNGNYTDALSGITKYTTETIKDVKTDITEVDIYNSTGKIVPRYEKEITKLKIEGIDKIDERNINTAMKIMESYEFGKILGRQLEDEERKILIEKLLGNNWLKKGKGCSYISTLYTKLIKVGLEEKEAYGAILNYAIGKASYKEALNGTTKYTTETIKDVKTDITEVDIYNSIGKIVPRYEKEITKLKIEGIDKIDERNINTAMKIMESYEFEKILGRQLEDAERKILIEKLLGNSGLKKGIGCSYISTLYTKLIKVGLEEKEAYGAILNYAIGNRNYTDALSGITKYTAETIKDVKTDITEVDIYNSTGKIVPRYEKEITKLKIEGIDKIDERNINTAMKIMESYEFEKILGRQLEDAERKILIEKLLGNNGLKKGKRCSHISTLYTKLMEVGLDEKEVYGAILNYAMGNGNYTYALRGITKYTTETIKDIKIDITEEEFYNSMGKIIPRYEEQITKLKIEGIDKIDEQNINTAMKIMESYEFEKILGRQLEDAERKILIEKLLGNNGLKKGRYHISTLYTKLMEVGLDEKEVYGAILNYAMGNGNYAYALNGKIKYTTETIKDIKIDMTEEDIRKCIEKAKKKVKRKNFKKVVLEQKNELESGNSETELLFAETIRKSEQTKESDNQEK